MLRRPPRSTRTDPLFPYRRSSVLHGHGHRVVFIFGKLRLQLRKHLFLFFPHVLFEERAELAQFSCPVRAMLVAAQIEEILLHKPVVMVEGLRSSAVHDAAAALKVRSRLIIGRAVPEDGARAPTRG